MAGLTERPDVPAEPKAALTDAADRPPPASVSRPVTGSFRPPQDFLRGQMREWLEQVQATGHTRDLFELEMWLRSFERFFRVKNQPLSEKETRQLALRSWS
jgi:hypothetical protein